MEETEDIHVEVMEDVATQQRRREEHEATGVTAGVQQRTSESREEEELFEVDVEREIDQTEERRLDSFLEIGCGCSQMCWKKFDPNYLRATRTNLLELDEREKDLVIMGQVMATTGCGESTIASKKLERERLKNYTSFYHGGVKVYNTIAWHLLKNS